MNKELLRPDLCEDRNGHGAFLGKARPVQLDSFDFMQSFGGKVAFPAMRATHHRHILDDEQRRAFAIASCHAAEMYATSITNIALAFMAFNFELSS